MQGAVPLVECSSKFVSRHGGRNIAACMLHAAHMAAACAMLCMWGLQVQLPRTHDCLAVSLHTLHWSSERLYLLAQVVTPCR